MALIGWPELILILAILIFLFGATKMKGLAKGLGESVREFKKVTKDSPDDEAELDDSIKDIAKKMGIETQGKKLKQILKEIENKRISD
jgi:sec-independent protein translocase protein TatA